MKKAAYDKSGIMKEAWNLFNNDDITLADFEHLGWMDGMEKRKNICSLFERSLGP